MASQDVRFKGDDGEDDKSLNVHVEFSGGLELLFDGEKEHDFAFTCKSMDLGELIKHLRGQVQERPELFVQDDTVRPGILVLVNEVDWELLGGLEYALQDGDKVVFISTLHGG